MSKTFAGKIAVVTGGSPGMGLATAKRFVREGMDQVFITGRGQGALDAAVAEIGKNVTAILEAAVSKRPAPEGSWNQEKQSREPQCMPALDEGKFRIGHHRIRVGSDVRNLGNSRGPYCILLENNY